MDQFKASQESIKLLNALKHENVRFAHWKGNTHLLESLSGKSDIELLIYPDDRVSFESIMLKFGFKNLISPQWNSYPDIEDWIGFDYETGALLHLHTHFALTTGIKYAKYLHLPWINVFFNHLTTDKLTGWPIPKPEMEVIILLLRIRSKLPENAKANDVPLLKQQEVKTLINQVEPAYIANLCQELNLKAPDNFQKTITAIIKDSKPEDILNLAKYFSRQLVFSNDSYFTSMKSLYYKYYLKTARASTRLFGPFQYKKRILGGGKFIALIGSDGSGKSTISKDITDWLTFKIDTHYFYFGKQPFIRSYNKKLFSKSEILTNKSMVPRILKKMIGDLYYVMMIKQKADMLQLGKKLCKKGSIIICDRFPQKDILGINDGPKLQKAQDKWVSKTEMKFFERVTEEGADMVFRLQVSPDVAFKRKPEHNYNIIKQKCEDINKITFKNSTMIELDASRPYDQVLLSVKREVWKNL